MKEPGHRVQIITLYTRVLLELIENPRISQEMLARRIDVTMRTAQRHLTELEEEGYITVDRSKKPFEYSINWEKQIPGAEWLRVIIFHPQVRGPSTMLVEQATQAYELARRSGVDPSEALSGVFQKPAGVPVTS
jgi:DNA-binding transcriptional regulator LsrR (DeoR family)